MRSLLLAAKWSGCLDWGSSGGPVGRQMEWLLGLGLVRRPCWPPNEVVALRGARQAGPQSPVGRQTRWLL